MLYLVVGNPKVFVYSPLQQINEVIGPHARFPSDIIPLQSFMPTLDHQNTFKHMPHTVVSLVVRAPLQDSPPWQTSPSTAVGPRTSSSSQCI